jgi:hypothetical protein
MADDGLSPFESVPGPGTADCDDPGRRPAWALAGLAGMAGLTVAVALVFGLTGWPDTGGGMLSAVRIGSTPSGAIPAVPVRQSVTTQSLEPNRSLTSETSTDTQLGAEIGVRPGTRQDIQLDAQQGDLPGGSDPDRRLVVPGALRIEDDGKPSEPSDVEDADLEDATQDPGEDEGEPIGDPVQDDSGEDLSPSR